MRVFANADSFEDGFGADWYSELSLEPIFENNLFLDVKGKVFSASESEKWKLYSGKSPVDCGWMINGKFYSENTNEYPDNYGELGDDFDNYGPRTVKYEIYKKGKLIETKYIEEEW